MANTRITITHAANVSATDVANILTDSNSTLQIKKLNDYLRSANAGVRRIKLEIEQETVAASQTLTCDQASAVATTDTLTVGGITCASVASGPEVDSGEWLLGADDGEMADNLAAAINGHTTLGKIVTAESDGVDTVTITAKVAGTLGNLVTLAEAGSGITLTGTALTGGDGGEAADITTFDLGVS